MYSRDYHRLLDSLVVWCSFYLPAELPVSSRKQPVWLIFIAISYILCPPICCLSIHTFFLCKEFIKFKVYVSLRISLQWRYLHRCCLRLEWQWGYYCPTGFSLSGRGKKNVWLQMKTVRFIWVQLLQQYRAAMKGFSVLFAVVNGMLKTSLILLPSNMFWVQFWCLCYMYVKLICMWGIYVL